MLTADAKAPGGIDGTGGTLVVEHTTDNTLMTFRFKNKDVKMQAAEDDFELNGHKFRAGAFIIPNADRAQLEPLLKDLGLSGMGRRLGADGQDARPRRSRASATSTPGRARRTKAGCAPRSIITACPTPTSPIRNCATATCARSTT